MKLSIDNVELLNNSITCPNCRSKSKIIDCRIDKSGTLKIRRHECLKCGFGWDTAEVTLEDLEYLLESSNDFTSGFINKSIDSLKELQTNIESYNKLIYQQRISLEQMCRKLSQSVEDI